MEQNRGGKYGGVLKWGYPQIIHILLYIYVNGIFPEKKTSILCTSSIFRKPTYLFGFTLRWISKIGQHRFEAYKNNDFLNSTEAQKTPSGYIDWWIDKTHQAG